VVWVVLVGLCNRILLRFDVGGWGVGGRMLVVLVCMLLGLGGMGLCLVGG